MTLAERDTYHEQYDRWLTRQEVAARRVVLRGFRVILNRITARLSAGQSAAQVLAALPVLITENDHATMIQQIYLRTGVNGAGREYARLTGVKGAGDTLTRKDRDSPVLPVVIDRRVVVNSPGISFFSKVWQERMLAMLRLSTTARRITLMSDKTRILIRDVLLRSVDRNWSLPQTTKALAGILGGGAKARRRGETHCR